MRNLDKLHIALIRFVAGKRPVMLNMTISTEDKPTIVIASNSGAIIAGCKFIGPDLDTASWVDID